VRRFTLNSAPKTGKKSESPHVDFYKFWILLCALCLSVVNSRAATTITKTNYHGWPNSYVLSNGSVEVIVVPSIGRVMQFKFAEEETGPFFENRAMDGKHPIPTSKEWGNFGGDKTWPSPQDDWPKITPRGWPPPIAFDSMPVDAEVEADTLRLISRVDPDYGIRTERVISLAADDAQMMIKTTYHKIEGVPRKVGIWIITQLSEPDFVFIPTRMGEKFIHQSEDLPYALNISKTALTLKRSAAKSTKIGTDADSIFWIGPKTAVEIESIREAGEYPDQGSSAEVYTNPNPLTYVELEMLGPLHTMAKGDKISQSNTYRLFHRADLPKHITENSL
jgi:hypothetical protein